MHVDTQPAKGAALEQVVDRAGYVHFIKRMCWCGHHHPNEEAVDGRSDEEVAAGEKAPEPGDVAASPREEAPAGEKALSDVAEVLP